MPPTTYIIKTKGKIKKMIINKLKCLLEKTESYKAYKKKKEQELNKHYLELEQAMRSKK